jgi:HD-like signal output (HDOD) protein
MSNTTVTRPPLPIAAEANPNATRIQSAISRIERLSSAPAILAKAMNLLRDAETDVEQITALVRGDPSLAAEILRISNSAFYGSGLKATSIDQALQRIGYREALRLLNLTVARLYTHINLNCYCISADDFWKESLFHGLFLGELARTTGAVEPEEAYTSGLLRYLGRLALNQALLDLGGNVFWLGAEPLPQWEHETLGLTQARAGATLLRQWRFSEVLVTACEAQESPALLKQPNWLASALYFTAAVLPQEFDQPFKPVLGSIADTDFLHPNQLSAEGVEQAFSHALVLYHRVLDSFA